MKIKLSVLKEAVKANRRRKKLNEGDDVFKTLGDTLKPDGGSMSGEPAIVKDARAILDSTSKDGKLTDPMTGKRYKSDYGTANLVVKIYEHPSVSDDTKEKLFNKVPITKLVSILWKNAEFKR
jgi:hypothetical protein